VAVVMVTKVFTWPRVIVVAAAVVVVVKIEMNVSRVTSYSLK